MKQVSLAVALVGVFVFSAEAHANVAHGAQRATELAERDRAAADVGELQARRAEARGQLLAGLLDHSDWLRGKKLFVQREGVLERICVLDPENTDALRALGWKKGRDGTWAAPEKPKKFKDYDKKALVEAGERYATATAAGVQALRELLDADDLGVDQRRQIEEDVLLVLPDDPAVHALRGEVQAEGGWVLLETQTSALREAQIAALVTRAVEDADWPEVVAASAAESKLANWTKVLQTSAGRVLGTVGEDELIAMAKLLPGSLAFAREMVGADVALPTPLSVVLLDGAADRDVYMNAHPKFGASSKSVLEGRDGTWVDGNEEVVYWCEEAERRRDGIVRLLVNAMLMQTRNITLSDPWAHEGFGLYLTEALTGTRSTWFGRCLDADGSEFLRERLLREDDWKAIGLELSAAGELPALRALIGRNLASFSSQDLLCSYLFAAYLFESRADDARVLLRRVGEQQGAPDSAPGIEQTLGRPLEELDGRLARWLLETRAVQTGELSLDPLLASAEEEG